MQEELEQAVRSGEDNLLPHVRRLHLVVTALREFFVALDVCLKKEQNLCNAGNLLQIKGLITLLELEIISECRETQGGKRDEKLNVIVVNVMISHSLVFL